MNVDAWEHVVTSALLGTDRRRLPGVDASEATTHLLQVAARHRAEARAGLRLLDCRPVPMPEGQSWPDPPDAARIVLTQLMATRQFKQINVWLAGAVARRVGLPADHWIDLIGLAARTTAIDRGLLSRVLGVGGRWFVEQNPQWSALARELRATDTDQQIRGRPEVVPGVAGDVVSDDELAARTAIAESFWGAQHEHGRRNEHKSGT